MVAERDIKQEIRAHFGCDRDVFLWNHPTGVVRTEWGGVMRVGLPGSPDLIGAMSVVISPQDVGRRMAVAVGIETKASNGKQSDQQRAFEARWVAMGGLYVLARSVADVEAGMATYREQVK